MTKIIILKNQNHSRARFGYVFGKRASPEPRRITNGLLKDISSYTFGGVDPAKASFFRM